MQKVSKVSIQANGSKFQTIVFSRMNKDNVPIMINKNIILASQSCVKLLGVDLQIDNRLTFHDHISSLCKKAGQKLGAVARLSKNLQTDVK